MFWNAFASDATAAAIVDGFESRAAILLQRLWRMPPYGRRPPVPWQSYTSSSIATFYNSSPCDLADGEIEAAMRFRRGGEKRYFSRRSELRSSRMATIYRDLQAQCYAPQRQIDQLQYAMRGSRAIGFTTDLAIVLESTMAADIRLANYPCAPQTR